MNDKKKITPSYERKTRKHKINEGERDGLITQVKEIWPKTEEGPIASWIHAAENSQSPREQLFDLLDELQENAQAMAKLDGCPTDSTLTSIPYKKVKGSRWAGTLAPELSLFQMAFRLENQIAFTRHNIEHFENHCSDEAVLSRYYKSMADCLTIAFRVEIATLTRYEYNILLGNPDKFNQKGVDYKAQIDAVRRVAELVATTGCSQRHAREQVAEESQISLTEGQIKKWIVGKRRNDYGRFYDIFMELME